MKKVINLAEFRAAKTKTTKPCADCSQCTKALPDRVTSYEDPARIICRPATRQLMTAGTYNENNDCPHYQELSWPQKMLRSMSTNASSYNTGL